MIQRKPPIRSVGTDPDYRFTLANERTFLAWVNIAVLVGGGGAYSVAALGSVRGGS